MIHLHRKIGLGLYYCFSPSHKFSISVHLYFPEKSFCLTVWPVVAMRCSCGLPTAV